MSAKRILVGALLAIVIVLLGIRFLRPQTPEPALPNPAASPAPAEPTAQNASDSAVNSPPSSASPSLSPASGGANTLSLLGRLQAVEQATLSTRMPARIVAVPIREGDTVRRGQLLVQLDARDLVTQARTAQAGVTAAQAQVRKAQLGYSAQRTKSDSDVAAAQSGLQQAQVKLRQAILARDAARDENQVQLVTAQEGVRKAQAALQTAQQTLRGLEALAQVGGVSRDDLQGARTQVTVAQADLATAQAQVRQLQAGPNASGGPSYRVVLAQQDVDAAQAGVRQAQEGVRTAEAARQQTLALAAQDIRAAEASLAQARAGATGAQAAVASAQIRSPLDGVAANVTAQVGETAQPGVPLVTVTSLAGLCVEALVPARQLSYLHTGQAAQVTLDTQPGRRFPAIISEIAQVAEPDGRTFRVKFRFRSPHPALRPGQTARILIPLHA